jgi:hypothetical protein
MLPARWKALIHDGRRGVFHQHMTSPFITTRSVSEGAVEVCPTDGEVGPRATVVQHQERKQPSQPTRSTKEMPIANDIAINQRSQRRAENVDTVGVTG